MSNVNSKFFHSSSEDSESSILLKLLDSDHTIANEKLTHLELAVRKFFSKNIYNRETIPDLVQETFLRAMVSAQKKTDSGEIIANVGGLVMNTAKNLFLEVIKPKTTPSFETLPDVIPEPKPKVDEKEREEEMFACLENCLEKLSHKDKDLFLSYGLGEEDKKIKITRKDLAEKCGKTPATLKIYIHRLREKVKICSIDCLNRKKM